MKNPIICVDFDGVIHSYTSGWKGAHIVADDPVPGAIEWLEEHLPCPDAVCAMAPEYTGPIVQIYSSRSKSWFGRRAMKKWLVKHGLHPAYIREGIRSMSFKVQKKACSTCIYRKDSALDIKKLERDIAGWREGEFSGYRICHHSDDVCCRGFWNRHKDHFNLGRIMQRLNGVVFVTVDTLKKKKTA